MDDEYYLNIVKERVSLKQDEQIQSLGKSVKDGEDVYNSKRMRIINISPESSCDSPDEAKEEILEIQSFQSSNGGSAMRMKEELGMSEHEVNLQKLKALQKLIKHKGEIISDDSSESG